MPSRAVEEVGEGKIGVQYLPQANVLMIYYTHLFVQKHALVRSELDLAQADGGIDAVHDGV